jgi:DNA-binding NarL/FixJ family response regulator
VKRNRKTFSTVEEMKQNSTQSVPVYVFCEKNTGAARFQVSGSVDGKLPLDEAASLLAMHCLVRGQSPNDYHVMVKAAGSLFDRVTAKARQLLDAGRAIASPIGLSRREKEVLDGVLENLANKEIASRLSISERTVKFHVSSLFIKFKVRSRMELMRQIPGFLGNTLFGGTAVDSVPAAAAQMAMVSERQQVTTMERQSHRGGMRLLTA